LSRRKSDIENERLPPDLFDAESEEGKAIMSPPMAPKLQDTEQYPGVNTNGANVGLERNVPINVNTSILPMRSPPSTRPPSSPTGKRGHARTASLGTTMTSPSTRRRSLESTMSLIQGVLDGQDNIPEEDQVDGLANQLAGSSVGVAGVSGEARGVTRPSR
jgi:serine/threonine-protein phosphatase 2B catalytic subunit